MVDGPMAASPGQTAPPREVGLRTRCNVRRNCSISWWHRTARCSDKTA